MTNAARPRRRPNGAEGPLTKLMRRVLKEAAVSAGGVVSLARVVDAGNMKAFAGSLVRRGFIKPSGAIFVITDAGREAVKGKP